MEFKSSHVIKFPLAVVWSTMRDSLPEIASKQQDIEYVRVEQKVKKTESLLQVVSTWKSSPGLPDFIKNHVNPEMLTWTDDAHWHEEGNICQWTIRTHYLPDEIKCTGVTKFDHALGGKGTKITFSGELIVANTANSRAVLNGVIMSSLEMIISKVIPNNFAKIAKAVGDNISARELS